MTEEQIKAELKAVYTENFGDIELINGKAITDFIFKYYGWLDKGDIQQAFTDMYLGKTPRVQHYGKFNKDYVTAVLNNYRNNKANIVTSTQAVYVEPTQEQKDKIAHEAVLVAFKRHKAGRHILLYKQYETLLKRFKMPDTYLDYMDKADIELKKRVIADKANAQLDNDRHKIKSLQQQLDNWQPVKANLIDVAKELAIKDYFDSLSKQHLEL